VGVDRYERRLNQGNLREFDVECLMLTVNLFNKNSAITWLQLVFRPLATAAHISLTDDCFESAKARQLRPAGFGSLRGLDIFAFLVSSPYHRNDSNCPSPD
jgi:hypothetical protein